MATPYHEYICRYINNNNDDDGISLAQFLKDEVDFIAFHTDVAEDYRSVWLARFMKACKTLDVTPKPCEPEWGDIAIAILESTSALTSSSSSSSSFSSSTSSSSSSYGRKLSISDRNKVIQMYDALDVEKMWTLSTGTKVESKMRQLAVQCNYEHPSHSLIMDPWDKVWMTIFSEDELKEIRTYNAPEVTALPSELEEFINTFDGKDELGELYLEKERTEDDLLRRVWSIIDTCFDMTNIEVLSGEKGSKAASERIKLAAIDPMIRKKNGVKVENLKDMLVEMESIAPSQLRNLKSCGFVIAGTFLQSLIMDSPAGYVARVNKLPNWLPYPIQADTFSTQFFSLIHIIWHIKMLMIEVEKIVKNNSRRPVLSYTVEQTQILTPCFVPTTNASASKRKYDVIE